MRALAVCLFVGISTQALAQRSDLTETERSLSALMYIDQVCTSLMHVNKPLLARSIHAFSQMLFNAGVSVEDMRPEINRRSAEVTVTGADEWCNQRRLIYKGAGIGQIFKR